MFSPPLYRYTVIPLLFGEYSTCDDIVTCTFLTIQEEEEGWWSRRGREKAREKREGARIGAGGSERRRSVFETRARGVKASPREVVSGGCWCDVTE